MNADKGALEKCFLFAFLFNTCKKILIFNFVDTALELRFYSVQIQSQYGLKPKFLN